MDFSFTEEQTMFRDMVRDFAQNEIQPLAHQLDEEARFPYEIIDKMKDLGLLGINTPEEYGGAGVDDTSLILAIEEIARACSSTAVTIAVHHSVVQEPIVHFGNEAQKQKFLLPLATGEKLGAFALTEPNAGSDAGSIATVAVKEGDMYRLNGSKMFITNGSVAGIYLVAAITDRSKGSRGLSVFIVERETPGLTVGKKENKMGLRASDTTSLSFEDCLVPAENILGAEGDGFKILMKTLDGSRIGVAAQAVGIAKAAFDASKLYASERQQFGKPINRLQAIQFMLADMATEIDAAELLTYRAAYLKENNKKISKAASMAKVFATEMVQRVAYKAVQIHGGYGYIKEYDVERYYRDARVTSIYEGTSEIQRLVIARNLD